LSTAYASNLKQNSRATVYVYVYIYLILDKDFFKPIILFVKIFTDIKIVQKGVVLALGAFLFLSSPVFATTLDPINFSPATQDVGSYDPTVVNITNGGSGTQNCPYWFDGAGNALSSHSLACGTGYPSMPTTLDQYDPSNLITDTVGTWTLIMGAAPGNSGSATCATGGGSLSACEAYFAGGSYTYYGEGTFSIVTPGGGGSTSSATSSVDQVQENIYHIFVAFVSAVALAFFGYFISKVT